MPKLTSLLKLNGAGTDEDLLELISAGLTACSGPMASGVRVRTLTYNGVAIRVKEGALGDGVGAKVWTVAHTLCKELVRHPEIVRGKSVLELGAGCGACGLLAAKLGAAQVVLTDYVDQLLANLRDALHLNFSLEGDSPILHGDAGGMEATLQQQLESLEVSDDDCAELPEYDAEKPWEVANASVRFIDWADSVAYLEDSSALLKRGRSHDLARAASHTSMASIESRSSSYSALDGLSTRSVAPGVATRRRFDVVIGTDVLYEWPMTESLAAAMAHRLKPGGLGLLCNAVRDQAMFDALVVQLRRRGLRVGLTSVQPKFEDGGVAPHDQEYEGGFLLIAMEHVEAPATWHREGLFPPT